MSRRRPPLAPERRSSRRGPYRVSRKRILVVCEGRVTEPEYLEYVKRQFRDNLLTIHIIGGYTDPLSLVRTSIVRKNKASEDARRQRDDFLRYDEVWCVSDTDTHPNLPEARTLASKNGVKLLISDPCFEVWLLLHFQDQTAHLPSRQAQKLLGRHMPNYEKSPATQLLLGRYTIARSRAKALCSPDGCTTDTNPTTHIWQLVDSLIQSARDASGEAQGFQIPL